MTATLPQYFPRQLRDMLLTRGAAMLVIGVVFSLPILMGALRISQSGAIPQSGAAALLDGSLRGTSPFLVMVATYGIIGEDVRRGYFRFLFAKPISPVLYYAQAFLAALIAFLAAQLIVVAVFALAVEPAWPERWLLERTVFFLSFGSVIFALSRVLPIDWLIGLLFFGVGSEVRDWYPVSESLRGKVFNVVFPPSHLMESGLFPVEGIEWGHVAWVVGYAAMCLAIGLSLVRFMPFGTQR
ncbi:MAG: hypothetical protein IIA27_09925 [Gemmatimonadetes bacterium]|nr:hypothetical protein [Gemmatimonadota bacterium]